MMSQAKVKENVIIYAEPDRCMGCHSCELACAVAHGDGHDVVSAVTAHLPLPRLLTAEPQEVAAAIFSADRAKRPRTLYVRSVWRPIMTIISHLPEPIFLRTRL